MNQELQYLRDELNQRNKFYDEFANKTINTVLFVWGGICIIFGNAEIKFSEKSFDAIQLYFLVATIIFISNLVLYFAARRHYNTADGTCRHAAYIAVFYEKRASNTIKAGYNFFWELALFETDTNNLKYKKFTSKWEKNVEYFILASVSTGMLSLLTKYFFDICDNIEIEQDIIILPLLCIIYILISLFCLCQIPRYTFLMDYCGMKVKHLKTFIKYALDTKHYTEGELKDRLSKEVWDIIETKATAMEEKQKNNRKWYLYSHEVW